MYQHESCIPNTSQATQGNISPQRFPNLPQTGKIKRIFSTHQPQQHCFERKYDHAVPYGSYQGSTATATPVGPDRALAFGLKRGSCWESLELPPPCQNFLIRTFQSPMNWSHIVSEAREKAQAEHIQVSAAIFLLLKHTRASIWIMPAALILKIWDVGNANGRR